MSLKFFLFDGVEVKCGKSRALLSSRNTIKLTEGQEKSDFGISRKKLQGLGLCTTSLKSKNLMLIFFVPKMYTRRKFAKLEWSLTQASILTSFFTKSYEANLIFQKSTSAGKLI